MARMTRRTFFLTGAAGATALAVAGRLAAAPTEKDVQALTDKGYEALKKLQAEDGSFAAQRSGPGVTALVVAGLIRCGRKTDDPVVKKAMGFLEGNIQKDGGIYKGFLQNYTTCVSLVAFKEANADKKYDKIIADAGKYLKGLQKTENLTEKDGNFGGVGYNDGTRPDLSNTHFFIDALIASGADKNDEGIKRALVYVGRCQNLASEHNPLKYAEKATDQDKGGFVYTPSEAEASGTGRPSRNATPEGGLRSYGSMSYAGLKSFLYAGLDKKDKRVVAALDWIRKHYSVTENPGQKDTGLFYYYVLFAKALDALGEDEFVDSKGGKHDWRQDLFDALKKQQKDDGSWSNSNSAFFENSKELATAYSLIALSYCLPKKK
jgi:squalene-hopene/tetraprenyl-beta-curcumene cyclase